MLRWLWILIGLTLIGIGIAFASAPKRVPVDVAQAHRSSIREYIEEQAKTRLHDTQKITMPMLGRLLPIELEEGDRVTAGQIVARVDDRDLETELVEQTNTVERYKRNLDQIDLAVQQAEQTVQVSQAKYDFFERAFSRTKGLRDRNTASDKELEQDELNMTESALDLRKEQLNKNIYVIMRGVVELMRDTDSAKRSKTLRDRERTVLRSAVDGVVLKKEESNERVLSAGTALLEIGDPSELEVEADILTQEVVKISVGDSVDIEGTAIGVEPVPGRVARIYPQGFTKISSLGVEQQRVTVIVTFEPEAKQRFVSDGRNLGVDYRLQIKIYTDEKSDAVIIPRSALFRSASGGWQVFVVRENKAALTDVTVGLRNDYDVEVLDGVQAGDQVVIAPDSSLEDGAELAVSAGVATSL